MQKEREARSSERELKHIVRICDVGEMDPETRLESDRTTVCGFAVSFSSVASLGVS